MLQKKIATGIAMLFTVYSTAQVAAVTETPSPTSNPAPAAAPPVTDKKPLVTFSGSVDVYYRYDFDRLAANNKTSFTGTHDAFALGMASIRLEHGGDKVGIVADLGFGNRAKEFSYNEDGITRAIKQLYITYAPAGWIRFTGGTWATHVGYELLDPQLNRNYSMSYMFTNGPFSHTGIKAELAKGKHGLMLGVSNATDYRVPLAGHINKKFLLAQYSIAPDDKTKIYLNYVGGKGPDSAISNQFDLVATAQLLPRFGIGFNGTLNETRVWTGTKNAAAKEWWGAALYLNADPKDWLGVTLRSELFNDKESLKGLGTSLFVHTLSANIKSGGFIFIPELRIESARDKIYLANSGTPKKSNASVVLAAVYKF